MLPYARRRTTEIPSSDFKATCLSSTQLQLETGWTVSEGVTVTLATIVNNTTMGTGKSLNYSHIKNLFINNGPRLHSVAFRWAICVFISSDSLVLVDVIESFFLIDFIFCLIEPWWFYLIYKYITFL